MQCPLCQSSESFEFYPHFFKCHHCQLLFKNPNSFLSFDEETTRYSYHQNNEEDQGYIKYLKQITEPLLKKLDSSKNGLDFGCGPGPTLSKILGAENINCDNYDPFFLPDHTLLNKKYDFIVSTEVFEHFHNPKLEIEKLWELVKNGGLLAVMTVFYPEKLEEFGKWWYKNDPTHVCFYNEEVFRYIGEKLDAEIEFSGRKVVFIKKREL